MTHACLYQRNGLGEFILAASVAILDVATLQCSSSVCQQQQRAPDSDGHIRRDVGALHDDDDDSDRECKSERSIRLGNVAMSDHRIIQGHEK